MILSYWVNLKVSVRLLVVFDLILIIAFPTNYYKVILKYFEGTWVFR